jgi:hypothetical protein
MCGGVLEHEQNLEAVLARVMPWGHQYLLCGHGIVCEATASAALLAYSGPIGVDGGCLVECRVDSYAALILRGCLCEDGKEGSSQDGASPRSRGHDAGAYRTSRSSLTG